MKKNGKCKVFIVEDDLVYQRLIVKQFDSFTYDVYCFTKGETCIDQIPSVCPDILILDYNLEGDLTGLQTLQRIRSSYSDTFAVVISSEKGLDTEDNYKLCGNFMYIEKNGYSLSFLKNSLSRSLS
jgi:CheY-like chemotaxis protein